MSMMADVGKVIFSRDEGGEADSDIWDDSALIKAYDRALAKVKGEDTEETENPPSQTQNPPKHKKSRSKKARPSRHWRVGDVCRVLYSGDSQVYLATITHIDDSGETCTVRYQEYDEEGTYNITDLKRAKIKHRSHSETESVASESRDAGGHHHHRHPHPPPPPHQSQPDSRAMPPPPPPGDMRMPPFPFPHPPWSSSKVSSSVPFIPPPPPPVLGGESGDEDSEAMCSMLMAWYMSGYHTGYYQGLREGKKLAASNQSPYR